jgi:acetyl-CoA carboxylase biotin carboxylase subunit
VEHPVTELITGLDIVEWQLRIAAKERISFHSQDIKLNGVAIECRINAEDPRNDFLPHPGLIERLIIPAHSSQGPVRIDTHIQEKWRVSPFYDSMLAKVITHGQSRKDAISLMLATLDGMRIDGICSTIDFHKSILKNRDFLQGSYDCSFIEKYLPTLI